MATTPSFQSLLETCKEMEFSHLRPLMERMFENADVALLDFAEKAENNVAQSVFFEAMNEFRKKHRSIEQHFFSRVEQSFDDFPVRPADKSDDETDTTPDSHDSLSLVDTEEVETYVASQNASAKLASRIMDRIFALKQRLTVINSGNAIEENQIPGGPAWLASAFQQAVEQLDLENKVRLVFIALFDKYVLGHADALFDEYNKRLIDADILPNLRYEVRKQAGGVEIIERELSDSEVAAESDADSIPIDQDNDDVPQSDLGDELFGRICELMSGRHKSIPGSSTTNTSVSSNASSSSSAGTGNQPQGTAHETLIQQINSLQTDIQSQDAALAAGDFIENIEIDENLIETLQGTIASEREKLYGMVDRRQLPAADTNIIELVGMMFEYMLQEEDLPNLVKALLSRLHTPLLKVAVVDKSLFTRADHPARQLLNDMTAAGKRWVDEEALDRGIYPTMQDLVSRILTDFRENVQLFDETLSEFKTAVDELNQRSDRVEQRTNEAASGQEKLQAARTRAQKEVRVLMQGKLVHEATQAFLRLVWADKLTFVLLRNDQADESPEWKQNIGVAERIIDYTTPPETTTARQEHEDGLEALEQEIRAATATQQKADKEKLLIALFEAMHQALDATPVSGNVVSMVEPVPAEEADAAAPAEQSQEQLDMLARLKDVPFGTWFEFRTEGKPVRRAKLSWRSTVTEKYMFVDQMGVKAAVISMHELADCMLDGKVRIVKAEKKPFVDRALSAIHRMLDHAA